MSASLQLPMLKSLDVVGGGHRENAQCLVCGSMDRERSVYLYLRHATSLFQTGGRVLYVTPEPLTMKAILQKKNFQLPDDIKVIEEILRVIKPNGYCILQALIVRALEATRYEVKWQSLKNLNPLQENRYGLIEKETLFVCKPRIKEALKA
jgi:hypothetical protein